MSLQTVNVLLARPADLLLGALSSLPHNGSSCSLFPYQPSFPHVCPISPSIPSFPLPAATPLINTEPLSLLDRIQGLFSAANGYNKPISAIEAIKQNNLPILRYWLEKDDRELAQHLAPKGFLHYFQISSVFSEWANKAAEEGNIPLVLLLLDRMQRRGVPFDLSRVILDAFEGALKGGQRDLIWAILRRGYPSYPLQTLFNHAIQQRPKIATELLLGANLPFDVLQQEIATAINVNHPELLCEFFKHAEIEKLLPTALIQAAKNNRVEVLKELFKRDVPEKAILDALRSACASEHRQAAHFLASQGTFYLNDKDAILFLVKTGFLSLRFLPSMIRSRSPKQIGNLLEVYLRFGTISDQDLIRSWQQLIPEDRFSIFRTILIDKSAISGSLQRFFSQQISQFSPSEQELAIRIAILKNYAVSFVASLIGNARLSQNTQADLAKVQSKREQYLERLAQLREKIGQNHPSSVAPWDEKEIRKDVIQNGAEILEWTKYRSDNNNNPRFRYFASSDVIGQIQGMPNLVFKSFSSRYEATERLALMERVRGICKEKTLSHIRVPNAFFISELQDAQGKTVSVNLIVEEMLQVASHDLYEIKAFLETLNQDSKTRKVVDGYFRELTTLVCATGLTDLKSTNVPLLADGTGLGLVDSSMQGDPVQKSLYAFGQPEHSLADWLAPANLEEVGKTLDNDPSCPKNFDRSVYEQERRRTYEEEKALAQFHLQYYGGVETAPIVLTDKDLESFYPEKKKVMLFLVQELNKKLAQKDWHWKGTPRLVVLQNNPYEGTASYYALQHLVRIGKIRSFQDTSDTYESEILIQC